MKKFLTSMLFVSIILNTGCKKFLEEKSNQRLMIPENLSQLQTILDNFNTMNNNYSSAAEVSTDDFFLTNNDYQALEYDQDRGTYSWASNNLFLPGDQGNGWSWTYSSVYASNSVMERLALIARTPANAATWDNIKAQALIFKAARLLDAAGTWTNAYDPATAANDLGLPLPVSTNFNEKQTRATLEDTYQAVIRYLREGIATAANQPLSTFRPGKAAGYGLLARTYLNKGEFAQARIYADSCLRLQNQLIDYNALDPSAEYPISATNPETIFSTIFSVTASLLFNTPKISPTLLNSYEANDLRRTLFFRDNGDGTFSFKGNYTGEFSLLCGVATDEMYLIRAEAAIRANDIQEGLNDLNTLLAARYRRGTFTSLANLTQQAALARVLLERRKELLFRGLRWTDIKRLNKLGANITLTRNINGQQYTLPPNSPRFALPLPEDVISLSGMTQNPQ